MITKFKLQFLYYSLPSMTPNERLEKLQSLANTISEKMTQYQLRMRRAMFKSKPVFFRTFKELTGNCKVCEKNKVQVRHHIIPLSKGGNNMTWNIIGICNNCHAEIHPWLKKEKA